MPSLSKGATERQEEPPAHRVPRRAPVPVDDHLLCVVRALDQWRLPMAYVAVIRLRNQRRHLDLACVTAHWLGEQQAVDRVTRCAQTNRPSSMAVTL